MFFFPLQTHGYNELVSISSASTTFRLEDKIALLSLLVCWIFFMSCLRSFYSLLAFVQ